MAIARRGESARGDDELGQRQPGEEEEESGERRPGRSHGRTVAGERERESKFVFGSQRRELKKETSYELFIDISKKLIICPGLYLYIYILFIYLYREINKIIVIRGFD